MVWCTFKDLPHSEYLRTGEQYGTDSFVGKLGNYIWLHNDCSSVSHKVGPYLKKLCEKI